MDIVYKKKDRIAFKAIAIGDVFSYTGTLYMRTQKVNSLMNGDFFNAVNLDTGGFYFLDEDDEVTPIKAKLVVS